MTDRRVNNFSGKTEFESNALPQLDGVHDFPFSKANPFDLHCPIWCSRIDKRGLAHTTTRSSVLRRRMCVRSLLLVLGPLPEVAFCIQMSDPEQKEEYEGKPFFDLHTMHAPCEIFCQQQLQAKN